MEPIYNLDIDRRAGSLCVRLAGEIDASVADEVRVALAEVTAAARRDGGAMAFDLSELRFIDSSGIRALVQIALDGEPAGLRVTVVAVSDPVRRVFDIAGVSDLLRMAPDAHQT